MSTSATTSRGDVGQRVLDEADALDRSVSDAIAKTPSPTLNVPMTWISNAANYSLLSFAIAGVLATTRGQRGRRAAIRGLTAVGATSFMANVVAKNVFPRRRPTRPTIATGRSARMPTSSSFPSGHTASAFAFAAAVTTDFPYLSLPLYGLATLVGYDRVLMGVHYPSDVMGGAVLGLAVGTVVREASLRLGPRSPRERA